MFRGPITRLALVLLAAVMAASSSGCIRSGDTIALPAADLAGPRLLVIAPHPDDEAVGVGGAIAMARQRGWDVTVVFVTCGDGFWQAVRRPGGPMPTATQMQTYGASRAAEARRATTALGVPAANVVFLGFPDGSSQMLWGPSWDGPAFVGRNGADKVPYAFALKPGAPYTGRELEAELEQVVRRVRPTTVLMPDAADVHRDHWAANAFAQTALVRSNFSGLSLTYVVHRAGYPAQLSAHVNDPLAPPSALLDNGTRWLSLPISDSALQAQTAAVADHTSQLRADGSLLRAFVRTNEVLGMAPASFIGTGTLTMREGAQDPLFKGGQPSASIRTIVVSRSATSSTVSLFLAAQVKKSVGYAVHVRAFGPGGQMRFYDGTVAGGRLVAQRPTTVSVKGRGELVRFGGDTVMVRLPPELIDGAQWLFIGADTYSGPLTADHAAWRLVRVLPR